MGRATAGRPYSNVTTVANHAFSISIGYSSCDKSAEYSGVEDESAVPGRPAVSPQSAI